MQKQEQSSPLATIFLKRKKEACSNLVFFFLFFVCLFSFALPLSCSLPALLYATENELPTKTPLLLNEETTSQSVEVANTQNLDSHILINEEKNIKINEEPVKKEENAKTEPIAKTEKQENPDQNRNSFQQITTNHNMLDDNTLDSQNSKNSKDIINTKDTTNAIPAPLPSTDFAQNAEFGWQKYFQAIGTMLFLLLALWYVLKLVKRYGQGKFLPNQKLLPKNSMYLEGQISLGPHKCVTIVNVLDRRLVLGVTENNISLLTEIHENDETEYPIKEQNLTEQHLMQHAHTKTHHSHSSQSETLQAPAQTQHNIQDSQTFHEHLYAHARANNTPQNTAQVNREYTTKNTNQNTQLNKQSQSSINNLRETTNQGQKRTPMQDNTKNKIASPPLGKASTNETSYEKRASRLLNAFKRSGKVMSLFCLIFLLYPSLAFAEIPTFSMTLSGGEVEPSSVSLSLEILFLFTILSLAPAIAMTVTSFTRIIIVFHFIRQAMGIQQIPPTQILASLAIFMSIVIMYPVGQEIHENALQPYLQERISFDDALERAQIPLRNFMFKHTREKDMSLFYSIAQMEAPQNKDEVPTIMLAAAFVISEFKTAFSIGFLIYIPFLIVDMVVSSILLAMGMMMLPPMMVSMPFKLLLFVVVDGWNLLIGSLVNSFLAI